MSLWPLLKREFYQMFITERKRAVFLFGASLAYLLLFSLLYGSHTIKEVPIVICDEDQTQFSRTLLQTFADSERFRIVSQVSRQEDLELLLREKTAFAALHIPEKFTQNAKSGHTSPILLLTDGANILIANTVTTTAQEIITSFAKDTGARFNEATLSQLPDSALHKSAPVELRLRVLNNPTQSYLSFFVLGLSMAAFQQGIFLAVGASIHGDYRHAEKLQPTKPLLLMLSKLVLYGAAGTLACYLTLAAAVQVFSIPGQAPPLPLLVLASSFIFAAVSFGSLLAALSNSELTFTRLSVAYTVPAFVLSGYTWPLEAMDKVGAAASAIFPLSYFSNALRELMLAGHSSSLWHHSMVLLVMGSVFFTLATTAYTRKLHQNVAPKEKN